MDKYVGRSLTDDRLSSVLESFFAPGGMLRRRAVSRCMLKLERLLKFFDAQVTWRFHSTSLLLVYEGDDDTDFDDMATSTELVDPNGASGNNLDATTENANANANNSNSSSSSNSSTISSSNISNISTTTTAAASTAPASGNVKIDTNSAYDHLKAQKSTGERTRVAVSLVDFAHAYMNHADVEGRQPQLDEGCRLGIRNVIGVLKSLCERPVGERRLIAPVKFSSSSKWSNDDLLLSSAERSMSPAPSATAPPTFAQQHPELRRLRSNVSGYDSEDGLEDVGPDDVLDNDGAGGGGGGANELVGVGGSSNNLLSMSSANDCGTALADALSPDIDAAEQKTNRRGSLSNNRA